MKRFHNSINSSSEGGAQSSDNEAVNAKARKPPRKKTAHTECKDWRVFRIQEGTEDAESELCHTCRTIDFKAAFNLQATEISSDGNPIFELDPLHLKANQTKCLACKMFISMTKKSELTDIDNDQGHPLWHLRVFRLTALWKIGRYREALKKNETAFVCLVVSPPTLKLSPSSRADSWERGIILPTSTTTLEAEFEPSVRCHALELSPYVQGANIRQMLDTCLKNHKCRPLARDFPVNAHVIECTTRRIVPLEKGMEYFALSYVWGKRSEVDDMSDDAFQKGFLYPGLFVPLTIEDAIRVVKLSHYRFLWVDRYCIQQHNSEDKKHQINQMANIYAHAVATICALGVDGNAGIDGVSHARKPQFVFKSQSLKLIKCPWHEINLQQHLHNSPWATRGWTFQEPLLSTRCLFFTSEHVIRVCQMDSAGEMAILHNALEPKYALRLNGLIFTSTFAWLRATRKPTSTFASLVQNYQKRSFTYESDAFDAVRGIFSVIKMQSYYGIPITGSKASTDIIGPDIFNQNNYDTLETIRGFAYGLLWHVIEPLERLPRHNHDRDGMFPSWSWLSQTEGLIDFVHFHGSLSSSTSKRDRLIETGLSFWPVLIHKIIVAVIQRELSDDEAISLGKLKTYHIGAQAEPNEAACIRITSLTARWKFKDNILKHTSANLSNSGSKRRDPTEYERRETGIKKGSISTPVILSDLSDPTKEVDTASIHFDKISALSPSLNKQPFPNRLKEPSREGLAILIFYFDRTDHRNSLTDHAYWLAVRQLPDQRYRREGIIESHLTFTDGTWTNPRKESLRTIRLV